MLNTAVILGTYNRAHLLRRSLLHYPADVTIYVYDDGSTDGTRELCRQYDNVIYTYLGVNNGWRDSAAYLNEGIKRALWAGYKYIFITHPEIIPGKTTIDNAKRLAVNNRTWISCKGYYLTPEQQEALTDEVNVKALPGFYGAGKSPEFTGNKDYLPEAIENIKVWQSWIFGGGSADMWRWFGGLTPFDVWGSVDVDLLNRRIITGMSTVTPGEPSDYVVHQNHDNPLTNTVTPRDMAKCMAALPVYKTAAEALKPQLLI